MEQAIKFKEGDNVRVVRKNTNNFHGWILRMEEFTGKIAKVTGVTPDCVKVIFTESKHPWYFNNEDVELFDEKHVGDVITWDDKDFYRITKVCGNDRYDFTQVGYPHRKWIGHFSVKARIKQKYQLRDAKGHFIHCERTLEKKPVKAHKPKAKGVVAKAPVKAAVALIKTVPEGITKDGIALRFELQKKRGTGMANYALSFTKSAARYQINDACHARLCWGYSETVHLPKDGDEITAMAMAIDQSFKNAGKRGNQYKDYVGYIIKDSPFKDCFLTHDVDDAITNGILFNINRNVSQIMGAAIALREGHEFLSKLDTWKDVIDVGFSKDVAFLVSAFVCTTGIRTESGHRMMSQRYGIDALARFMKKGFVQKLPPIYNDKKQTKYEVHNTIFGENTGKGYLDVEAKAPKGKTIEKFLEENSKVHIDGEGWRRSVVYSYEDSIPLLSKAFQDLLDNYKG